MTVQSLILMSGKTGDGVHWINRSPRISHTCHLAGLVDLPRSPKKGGEREIERGGEEREGEGWRERDERGGGVNTLYSHLLACVIHTLHRLVHNPWCK